VKAWLWCDKSVEIRELRAFVAVAEEGSFSAAARTLHLSQSALSQTVQSLERQLGVQLLQRHSTGVTITDAGTVLLREARVLLAQHDRVLAAVTGPTAAGPGTLRVGLPLELPASLLPSVLEHVRAGFPLTRVDVSHDSSSAQMAALREGELDVALVREHPADPVFDAVLAVEEDLGVVLAASRASELAAPDGVRLHQLADLDWVGFSRSEAPAWYDQVVATLRSHGITVSGQSQGEGHPLIAEVKLASVGAGRAFALAPPDWPGRLPGGVTWLPLIGNPIVRRTWAAWQASSSRRDLAALVAALDLTAR
jgi:DNA-binding transcriptional LysR family regulator